MPWKTQALFIHLVHLPVTHPSIHLHIPIHPSTYLHSTHPHTPCLPTPTWLPTHLSIHQLHLFSHQLECPIHPTTYPLAHSLTCPIHLPTC